VHWLRVYVVVPLEADRRGFVEAVSTEVCAIHVGGVCKGFERGVDAEF